MTEALCHAENGDLYSGFWVLARGPLPDFRQEGRLANTSILLLGKLRLN